ncbi:MAG: glycoside hydrolase family 13 protein, partial [Turicibacter sp.]
MKKEAILHVGKSSYAYAYDEETMHIRIRVAKDDMMSVSLYCADPYEWTLEDGPNNIWAWNRKAFPMSKEFSTSMFDFYTITFKPPYQRLKYGFILNDGQEEVLYLERGFFALNDPSIKNDGNSYFAFPFMSPEDIFKAPAWAKETNWYQIFPERFANGDSSIDPQNVLAWDSELPWDFENPEKFFGGDIQGIIDHLNHLEDLGINGIYLTPIFEAPSTHKYDTLDYYKIDPHFGDNETFKILVKEAHIRGMRIMLDGVFNHIGFTSMQFQDVIKNGENSPYKDWFYINQFPVVDEVGDPIVGAYRTFGFTTIMPKLNTNNPEVKQYLIDIATYWIKEFNIDAWRLDVANEIGHVFWREFRQAVKAVNPDVFIVGEAWHDSTPWLQGDQFDSMMNYPLTKG